jgi:nicotinamidase-related amidase
MTCFRTVLWTSGLIVALFGGTVQGQSSAQAASASAPLVTLQMPARPNPVPVTLNPATTALLVFDYVNGTCTREAECSSMVPTLARFMARARKAGVLVGYGTRAHNASNWIPAIAPAPGDIKVTNTAQDRFYNTDLDKELKAKGITTVIMAGWSVNGSVTYTSVGATAHGYTVVIPIDTTSGNTDYQTAIGFFQILNQDDRNPTNQPLKPKTSTLSRTDLITFR